MRKNAPKPTKPNHRFCTICLIEKSLDEFRPHKKGMFGVFNECKPCENSKYYAKYRGTPEQIEHKRVIAIKSRIKRKAKINARNRMKYANDPEYRARACAKHARWKTKNHQRVLELRIINRDRNNAWYKNRRATDPLWKLAAVLRSRTQHIVRRIKTKRSKGFNEYIGCTVEDLKAYIEAKFKPGMTWENWGFGPDKWHIDHIMPLWTATTEEEMYKLVHYTNLQPLWQPENMSKGRKLPIAPPSGV